MRICLLVDPARLQRWHSWLAEALVAEGGHVVEFCTGPAGSGWPVACRLLLALERFRHRPRGAGATDEIDTGAIGLRPAAASAETYDLVIDCAGGEGARPVARRVLMPLFDGIVSELGIVAAFLDGRQLDVTVEDSLAPDASHHASPAIYADQTLTGALDSALARTAELLLQVVAGRSSGEADRSAVRPTRGAHGGTRRLASRAATRRLAKRLSARLTSRLDRQARSGESWALGFRFIAGEHERLPGHGGRKTANYQLVAVNGARYLADPFPVGRDGRHYVFCEEFCHADGRGRIAVLAIGKDGKVGPSRVVLDRPHHLSYPFIFEHGGETWMMPESGGAGTTELYRAAPFPDRWVLEGRILEGVPAYDATLHRVADRWWLLATTRRWTSTSWDSLSMFSAPDLLGPWQPHAHNPVLIDARCSRPAGTLFRRGQQLLRPAQDCSRIYGGAIRICRIDRLDDNAFEQTPIGSIVPASPADGIGVHTLNASNGIELIDVFRQPDGRSKVEIACEPVPVRAKP